MGNFLLLFIRYGGFIAFLILEGLSLFLVVRYNKKQQDIYLNSANILTGSLYQKVDNFVKYYRIADRADSLAADNARLRNELFSSRFIDEVTRDTAYSVIDTTHNPVDTIPSKMLVQHYSYIAAEIINNSIVRPDNFITLNRGSLHGIKLGMGVISSDGLVGIVRNVSPHFSLVMSVLNKQTSISVSIRRNHYFGSLVWKGNDPRYMTLEAIPKHAELRLRDTVQTSGYSEIFPAGLMVGVIEKFGIEPGSNFYTAKIRMKNDLSNMRYVYVVDNLFAGELKALQESRNE